MAHRTKINQFKSNQKRLMKAFTKEMERCEGIGWSAITRKYIQQGLTIKYIQQGLTIKNCNRVIINF